MILCQLSLMESFVEDLLNLRLLSEGLLQIDKIAFDPLAAIDQVVGMMQTKAHAQSTKLTSRVFNKALFPKWLVGDERRLKQVMINLIKNALKFTKKGRIKIKVSYDFLTSSLIVSVEDTGVGIAHEDFPKLFSRFGKLQRTAKMNGEGIGLGLNIVKQIVELCEGDIYVESEGVGHGSTFKFSMAMQ